MDDSKEHELDRLLNDPDVPMRPHRIWELLDELSARAAMEANPRAITQR